MSKKQKKTEPKRAPTKHQLSKWQRQMRIRRIIISVAAVFLVGLVSWVGYGYYKAEIKPFKEVVIKVNDASFDMGYYVKTFAAYTKGMEPDQVYSMADMVTNNIIYGELMKQKATNLGIETTPQEIDKKIKDNELPDNRVYRDIISIELLYEKLTKYFDSELPDKMEQAHAQVMLVESQEVANEVIARIEAGTNFTALSDEFSCSAGIEGDLGWLPKELMPNSLIGDAAFNLEPGELSQPIYDESAIKNVGYWIIELLDKRDEKVRTRVILLGNKEEAEEVKDKIGSEDFLVLVQEYSQHDESRHEGGDLVWLEKGYMGSEVFDRVAFNLTPGEVSEPVRDESIQTAGGYWLIMLSEKAEQPLEEDARQRLGNNLLNDWIEEQEANSIIENLLDVLKQYWAAEEVLQGR